MTFQTILNSEIVSGEVVDNALLTKVKDNFDNHEIRLVTEEADVNVIHAIQIAIDDFDALYVATEIESALAEVMTLTNANYAAHGNILADHGPRISSLETRADITDTRFSQDETRISNTESNLVVVETRVTSNEATDVEQNDFLSFQGCASINKVAFMNKLTVNSGAALVYDSTATNMTGTGVIRATATAQTIKYNTTIPINALLGIGAVMTVRAPTVALLTLGFECYNASKTVISTVNLYTNVAGTAAFQKFQSHLVGEGVGVNNFPIGTRFVKPVLSFTGNTGNVDIDFLAVSPLMFASYTLFV